MSEAMAIDQTAGIWRTPVVRHAAPVSPTAPTVAAGRTTTNLLTGGSDPGSNPGPPRKSPVVGIVVAVIVVAALGGAGLWATRQGPATGVMSGQSTDPNDPNAATVARQPLDPRGIGNLNDIGAGPGAGPAGPLSSLVPTPPPTPVPTEAPRVAHVATPEVQRTPKPVAVQATPHEEVATHTERPDRPRREETHAAKGVLDPSRKVTETIQHHEKTHSDVSDETNPLGIPGG